jgi:hypothetical protein
VDDGKGGGRREEGGGGRGEVRDGPTDGMGSFRVAVVKWQT